MLQYVHYSVVTGRAQTSADCAGPDRDAAVTPQGRAYISRMGTSIKTFHDIERLRQALALTHLAFLLRFRQIAQSQKTVKLGAIHHALQAC